MLIFIVELSTAISAFIYKAQVSLTVAYFACHFDTILETIDKYIW